MTTEQEYYTKLTTAVQVYVSDVDELSPSERFWNESYEWLESKGYRLRPRYRPGWKANWTKSWNKYEDSLIPRRPLMDATRISDGKMVIMKRLWSPTHDHEIEFNRKFSSGALATDPFNHSNYILDLLEVPGYVGLFLMVMPFMRSYNNPRFLTIGESMDFFQQLFEGIAFLHRQNIAHRDIHHGNVLMDASDIYPEGFHPIAQDLTRDFKGAAKHYSRTEHPPRYYLIDLGLSRHYDPANGPPLDWPVLGGNKTVPEFEGEGYKQLHDPFPTDIYYAGQLIREHFLRGLYDFHFIYDIVVQMVDPVPSERPNIEQVLSQLVELRASLTSRELRTRALERKELVTYMAPLRLYRAMSHSLRTLRYRFHKLPPIPSKTTEVDSREENVEVNSS
ncbi:hypothetical protein M422DRAFT_36760 [Sphaerobolus stellatus SS14]|uniref:Protein kinase domain-containing protein n=1 Tax=Sphaerobolus stellatus (strain SS14) TaxID=990650 RepID=A0A0C9TJV1_SPHS4|nr:hypothetical protein M422DRAFT_36760 [Sphaerobolus stellatus SS14]